MTKRDPSNPSDLTDPTDQNNDPPDRSDPTNPTDLIDVPLTRHTTVLLGDRNGKYPDANSLLVRGRNRTALIDPALGVAARDGQLPPVDTVLLSHCHEDHFGGLHLFPEAEVWVHETERVCLRSLDDLLDMFGVSGQWREETRQGCIDTFNYVARPDAIGFADGHLWDLGGVTVRAIHAPGHTSGHSLFYIEPDDVLFLTDIDLSSFGPFYADTGSSIDQFERSIEMARNFEATHYVSAHHKGIADRQTFTELIEKFARVIPRREQRLLEFLDQPRTLDEIVEHRFIYRPGDPIPGGDFIERVGMQMHLDRLLRRGRVQTDGLRYTHCK